MRGGQRLTLKFFSGAGTSLAGPGKATIEVVAGGGGQGADTEDIEGTVATFRQPKAGLVAGAMLDAEGVVVVVTGGANQRHSALFNTMGMTKNLDRLPCSL